MKKIILSIFLLSIGLILFAQEQSKPYNASADAKADLKKDYIYVLLNYSKENKNWDLMEQFRYPNRFGFPVFVVLDREGKLLHTQDSGMLENCDPKVKGYDTTKVVTFLKQWNVKALDPATYKTN
jgi:hypothetical protein